MLRTVLGLTLTLVLGLPFTLSLRSWPARLGIAFLTGAVLMTGGLTIVGAAGLHYGAATFIPLLVLWLVAAGIAMRKGWQLRNIRPSVPRDWVWPAWALLAGAALNVATVTAYALRWPISDWDVVKIWLPKAELISTGGFNALAQSVYPDYPPLWPLHLYVVNGGGAGIKLLPVAYLVATLLVVFDFVRARVGPAMAAACVLAISGVPYVWLPYGVNDLMSEIATMALVTGSTIMLAEWVDKPSIGRAALTAILAMGTAWARPEGFFHAFLIAVVLVAAGAWLHTWRHALPAAVAIVFAYLAWRVVVHFVFHFAAGLAPNPSALTPDAVVGAMREIVRYAAANVGDPYLFGPALIAVALIALGLGNWRSFWVVGLILVIDVGVGVATYVALPSTDVGEPLIWWLTTGFKRMLLHFAPLLYVTAALAVGYLLRYFPRRTQEIKQLAGLVPRGALATAALSCLAILIAGYAAYQVGGPKAYDLSEMTPAHVSGSLDSSRPGAMSMTIDGNSDPQILFYLQNTGRSTPPLDNMTGVFGLFSAQVRASGSAPELFTASVDGRTIGEAMAEPGGPTVSLSGSVPIGGRFLTLSVHQSGTGSGTVSWFTPTLYRATVWWATDALLAISLAIVVGSVLAIVGLVPRDIRWLTPSAAAIPLLGAATIQLVEALWEVAMPIWAFGVETVVRHL